MSDASTKYMVKRYVSHAEPSLFLSGMFQAPQENFFNTEAVEFDIERSGEDVAVAIQDMSAGYRINAADVYTNKSFVPPVFKEAFGINSFDLLKRQAGANPFQQPDFRGNLIERAFRQARQGEKKIRRSMEWQASQVLQTGTITLIDSAGVSLYTVDFKPKTSHFPTAGTAWSNSGADIEADLAALADAIRKDGLTQPNQLIFGQNAWQVAIKNDAFRKLFEARRIDLGTITPMTSVGNGGQYRGKLDVGNYQFDLYTYNGHYKHPQSGVSTPFVDPDKVIMRTADARMDAFFGAIPNIGQILNAPSHQNLLGEMPSRIRSTGKRIDLHLNSWLDATGESMFVGVGARPLYVPTAIDTFGCIDANL